MQVGGSISYLKDALLSLSILPVQNNVSQYMSNILSGWDQAGQIFATHLFDDPDMLYDMIKDGQLIDARPTETVPDIAPIVERALFANTLRLTWSTGAEGSQVFIA